LKNEKDSNISNIEVIPSGIGSDGGRDILINFELNDQVTNFIRKWVVQCKFHKNSISTAQINKVNIPTLIHSYNASGYLLICKSSPTSGITNLFERLNQECAFKYHYECWNGAKFLSKLLHRTRILEQYFPKYYKAYQESINNK
jgi:hypothetical protein